MSGNNTFNIIKCPECGKSFVYNPSSIYKGNRNGGKIVTYCGYTCWRSSGADDKKARVYADNGIPRKPRGKAVSKKKEEVVV